jgi:hypothetical protein
MRLSQEFEISNKRYIDEDELNKISTIYFEELPSDILPNLGINAIKEYFELMLKNNSDIIIIKKNQDIVGFIVLRFKKVRLRKLLNLKSTFKFFFNNIFNPSLFLRLFFQIFIKVKIPDFCSEIHAFAVKKEFTSRGAGKILINESEKVSKEKKFRGIFTKTHNERLYQYYLKDKKVNLIKKYNILKRNYYNIYWDL